MHSTRGSAVARASAASAAGKQRAPLWFTRTTDSSGAVSMRLLYWQPMPHGRSILLVAQLTPPSPLVGAHRPAALTKYLARRGHRVTVLTSMASGRGDVPGAVRVIRTRDLLSSPLNWRRANLESLQGRSQATYAEPSPVERLVVPDLAALGWLPFALARAAGHVRPRAV